MRVLLGLVLVSFVSLAVGIPDAEAKRFGVGKSFGSKKMFSAPQKRSAKPEKSQAAPSQAGAAKTGATTSAAAAGTKSSSRAGLMGGLAGLAMGGLLGAMFFGGAFENINFLDVLIFGLIAFMLFKLLSGRRRGPVPQAETAAAGYGSTGMERGPVDQQAPDAVQTRQAERSFDTDLLFKKRPSSSTASATDSSVLGTMDLPKGFDQTHFLEGARSLFARMQKAWDEGDLGEIRQFTTDKVFAEVQEQLWAREGENRTEILQAHAELFSARELDNELEASVLFDVQLSEEGETVHVQELWHFTKPKHSVQPTWYLDGIQQIED